MALLLDLLVTGKTRLNDDTYAKNIYADKFIKNGSSDSYVLLGGGGHKTLNDFSMANHTHSDYLPCLRMRNPSNNAPGQGGIPFPLSLKGAGYPIYDDPEFATGTNGVIVYNNHPSSGAVTLTRIDDNQASNNSSKYILQISTSTGAVTPGRGGFIQRFSAEPNAVYAQIFRAKIPVGFSVVNAENPMGTNFSTHWLTDTAGTGKWEWYIRVTICGKEGNFNINGGGYVYLEGTGAVTWYLSYCNAIDLTKGNYDGLRTRYSDQASCVTVGNNNDNVNYNMVFHGGTGGTSLYSSTGIYCNPNTGIMTLNGLSLLNTGDNCLNINGSITSYKQSGAVLSTYNNSRNSIYSDTIYNLGSGNLSINAPGGNLYLSRERGKTYIGGNTYYIDRAGNLGSESSTWQTIWSQQLETVGINCTRYAKFFGRFHLVPTDLDDVGQYIAGGLAPVVLVSTTTAVTVPAGQEDGAFVILIKVSTTDKTYRAANGITFCCCWQGGSRSASAFTQTQRSCMMIYNQNIWYVMQFM